MSYAVVTISEDGIARANKLLAAVKGGAYRAQHNALKRAAEKAETDAGRFAAEKYAITKRSFMQHTQSRVKLEGAGGSVVKASISFVGAVIPLLEFHTRWTRGARLSTVVKLGGGGDINRAWIASVFGPAAVFERVGNERFPIEQKYGPSTAHMMQEETVISRMDEVIADTFEQRLEHEIYRLLNGFGG